MDLLTVCAVLFVLVGLVGPLVYAWLNDWYLERWR